MSLTPAWAPDTELVKGGAETNSNRNPVFLDKRTNRKAPWSLQSVGKTRKKKADRAPRSVDVLHYSQAHKTITMAHLVLKAGGGMKPH